jgi:hypothetical protein
MENVYTCGLRDCIKPCIITFCATVAFVLIVHLILYFKLLGLAKKRYAPAQAQAAPGAAPAAENAYEFTGSRGLWYDGKGETFRCGETLEPGYCIVKENEARRICDRSNACVGYIIGNRPDWNKFIIEERGAKGITVNDRLALLVRDYPTKQKDWENSEFYQKRRGASSPEQAAQAAAAAPDTTYEISGPRGLWYDGKGETFKCDETFEPGYCIVKEADAKRICDSSKDCIGYAIGNRPGWNKFLIDERKAKGITVDDRLALLMRDYPTKQKDWENSEFYQKKTR